MPPLTRRIIMFNLAALGVLMCCILWVYGTDGRSEFDRERRLLSEAELIAELIELRLTQQSSTLGLQRLRVLSLVTLLGALLRKGPTIGLYTPDLTWLFSIERLQIYYVISDTSILDKPTLILSVFKHSSEFSIKRSFEPVMPRLWSRIIGPVPLKSQRMKSTCSVMCLYLIKGRRHW